MAQINVERLSRPLGSVDRVVIPPVPRMPPQMIRRFPELQIYQDQWDHWRQQVDYLLNKVISSAERNPQPDL